MKTTMTANYDKDNIDGDNRNIKMKMTKRKKMEMTMTKMATMKDNKNHEYSKGNHNSYEK